MVAPTRKQRSGLGWRPLLAVFATVGLLGGCEVGLDAPTAPPPVDPPAPAPAPEPAYVPCTDTHIQVSWRLVEDGVAVECLPGDTVSVRVDSDQMIADFPCSDGVGLTPPVEGGVVHDLSFVLRDRDGQLLSATGDVSLSVVCGDATVAPEVDFQL